MAIREAVVANLLGATPSAPIIVAYLHIIMAKVVLIGKIPKESGAITMRSTEGFHQDRRYVVKYCSNCSANT